mmetsp:Transcript_7578/g.14367  ORF Transcript_7578/g.14367 Transcript_7578/m.14367 type:complete len:105 (+) Transcript_7578:180-494(+)
MAATNYNAEDSLLGDDEKKRRFFWSILWLIFSIGVALPLCSMLAPIWLMLQLVEAFLPVLRDVNIFLEKLLTWPRMLGVAIYESSDTFPNPLLKDLDNTVTNTM